LPSPPPSQATPEVSDPLAWLFGPWNVPTTAPLAAEPEPHTVENWETTPPPARWRPEGSPPDVLAESPPNANGTVAESGAAPAGDAAVAAPADTAVREEAAAPTHAPARRGLGTKRALYYRISRTRQLLWAWGQAGKYLNSPSRLLTRPG